MDISKQTNTTILTNQEFDSFEQLSQLAQQWGTDFRQLSHSLFKPRIFQAITGSILISNARFGCHVEQRGSTPPGMRTFAVPHEDCPDFYWFGQIVSHEDILLFPAYGEIESFTRAEFSVTTISIPENQLAEFFERNDINKVNHIIRPEEMVKRTSKVNLHELRYLTRQLIRAVDTRQHFQEAGFAVLNDTLENQILLSIFNIMTDNHFPSHNSLQLSRNNNPKKLKLILDYIQSNDTDLPYLETLCQLVKISERTLQYLFKRELGMTPKAYIKGQRLSKAHKVLWQADPFDLQIKDVANQLGFWHMGQFAADYRKQFGELPSDTLKR